MAYQMISYGSSGDSVKELQKLLNQQGYALDVDGIFGEKTRSAVRSYQKKNNLLLDGIVGEETWGSLYQKNQETPVVQTAQSGQALPQTYQVSKATAAKLQELEAGYVPSAAVKTAREEMQRLEGQAPAAYESGFARELAELYGQISSRPGFSYDVTADPAYAAYAREYIRQGKAAMTDTLGKAAALTGGYGSTYAQTAAQQAYDDYLEQLGSVMPELQKSAYARYQAEGEALMERYALLKGQDQAAYERWQDQVEQWQKAVQAAQNKYHTLQSDDLKNYQTLLKYYADKASKEYTGKLG